MIINHNLAAMNTYNQYSSNNKAMSSSLEKLSSGLRINSAADDAAGLAISEKMRGQIRGLDQASANAQDGISMVQTAEGALSETESILQRMRELATQASNDTNTENDRSEIQKEMNQLTSEINRIGNTTEFNTQKLLRGDTVTGVATDATETVAYAAAGATIPATAGVLSGTVDLTSSTTDISAKTLTIKVDGGSATSVDITSFDGSPAYTVDDLVTAINGTTGLTGIASKDDDGHLVLTSGTTGTSSSITVGGTAAGDLGLSTTAATGDAASTTATATAAQYTFSITTNLADKDTITVGGKTYTGVTGTPAGDDEFQIGANATDTATALAAKITADTDNTFTATAATGTVTLTQRTAADTSAPEVTVGHNFTSNLQIGANTGQGFTVSINDMRADALDVSSSAASTEKSVTVDGVQYTAQYTAVANVSNGTDDTNIEYALDVSTADNATAAIEVIDEAINTVSAERSNLGAYQNRLEHTINNLSTSSENMTSAESRIRDVDMAKEMMNYQKTSVLQQAAQAMLAQANQQPQGVLKLLQ